MTVFNVHNQCLLLATNASCILFFTGIMSSAQTAHAKPGGMTITERCVCTSCEQHQFPAFFVSKRACKNHIAKTKACRP